MCSIVDYDGEVFGHNAVDSALKVHAKTKTGILRELSLLLAKYRNHVKMVQQYQRIIKMCNNRLIKQVFNWDKSLNDMVQTTWYSEVQNIFSTNNLQNIFQSNDNFDLKTTLEKLQKMP